MTEDTHDAPEQGDVVEQRSLSGTVIQGVAATGALAYGLGHLAEGVAKVKDSFGDSGGQGSEQAPPPPPAEQPSE